MWPWRRTSSSGNGRAAAVAQSVPLHSSVATAQHVPPAGTLDAAPMQRQGLEALPQNEIAAWQQDLCAKMEQIKMALNQEVSAINQQATEGKIIPQKAQQQIEQRKQHWEHQIEILQQTSTIMQVQQKKVEQIQMQMMQEMAAIELQVTSGAIPAEQAQQQIIQSRQLHERQIQTLQQQMLIKQQQKPEMQMMGGVGITLEPASAGSNGCCVVKEIKMGGSVQMSGKVQLGDRLLRVNKVSCVGLSREQIKEYVVGPVGTRVEMVFDRDSQVITVELLRQLPQAAEAGWREVERVVRVATPHQQQHQPSSVVQQNPPLHPDYDLEAAIAASRCTLLFS